MSRAAKVSLKNVTNEAGLPITYDSVMLPLLKAKAVLWLLNQINYGDLSYLVDCRAGRFNPPGRRVRASA